MPTEVAVEAKNLGEYLAKFRNTSHLSIYRSLRIAAVKAELKVFFELIQICALQPINSLRKGSRDAAPGSMGSRVVRFERHPLRGGKASSYSVLCICILLDEASISKRCRYKRRIFLHVS
jgi:hypothetical protein